MSEEGFGSSPVWRGEVTWRGHVEGRLEGYHKEHDYLKALGWGVDRERSEPRALCFGGFFLIN